MEAEVVGRYTPENSGYRASIMANNGRVPWARLGIDGIVIIVSILLAFWIDASWEEGQERQRVERRLEAVLQELQIIKRNLVNQRVEAEAIVESATRLLDASASESMPLSVQEFDRLVGDLTFYNFGTPWTYPALNALTDGNELSLLENQVLATELVILHGKVQTLMEILRSDQRFHLTTFTDFALKNLDWPQVAKAVQHVPGRPGVPYPYPEFSIGEVRDQRELLQLTEFQNIVILKMERQLDLLLSDIGFDPVQQAVDRAIASIASELKG